MKNSIFFIILLVLVITQACHKVSNDLQAQFEQPSINTTNISLPDGSVATYPANVMAGDTITLTGRLNLSMNAVIRLGNENAAIIKQEQFSYKYPATGKEYTLEVAKFIVTAGMGTGRQPLTVTCGAYQVQGPPINILTGVQGASEPDTNLVVTKQYTIPVPDFAARYTTYFPRTFFQHSVHLTNDGTIYFSSTQDAYSVNNGQLKWLLKKEDGIQINGVQLEISSIVDIAPDPGNTTCYFSLVAQTNAPDGYNTLYLLLKKDLATGNYTVLNKTELDYNRNVRPAGGAKTGAIDKIAIFPDRLKVDKEDRLLFNTQDGSSGRNDMYYCRMDKTGNVSILFQNKAGLVSAFKMQFLYNYTQDGMTAFVAQDRDENWPRSAGITVLDLASLEPVRYIDTKVNILFGSFDPVQEQRMGLKSGFFDADPNSLYPGKYFPLNNQEMLFLNGYSIASINPETAYKYAYAGMERGCGEDGAATTALLPAQSNFTGKAKYVNFGYNTEVGTTQIIGTDASGKIYLMRGGQLLTYPKKVLIPPVIYTIAK